MLSGSEASGAILTELSNSRCFAAAQHDTSVTVFHNSIKKNMVMEGMNACGKFFPLLTPSIPTTGQIRGSISQ